MRCEVWRQVRCQEASQEEIEVCSQMCTQVRAKVWSKVQPQELTSSQAGVRSPDAVSQRPEIAAQRLVETYTALAARGEHLLKALLDGSPSRQWQHYPEDDAIDLVSGYQWFYHSHSPEDRLGATEHGHFHLFARRPLWARQLQSSADKAFARFTHNPKKPVNTRHLLTIGMNAKGVPESVFTVNSWVTGDLMLSAPTTALLLAQMRLNTGHYAIDTMLECLTHLCSEEIAQALSMRDATLSGWGPRNVLTDESLEVLSEVPIDLDQKLASI